MIQLFVSATSSNGRPPVALTTDNTRSLVTHVRQFEEIEVDAINRAKEKHTIVPDGLPQPVDQS
jgi:hypothetical protein